MTNIPLLESVNRALGQVRAEYADDDELYARFALPVYVHQLTGITPTFLVGGRGTGKTTTLRSIAFRGQQRITGTVDPSRWESIGGYWKAEPTVVSVFKGKGVLPEVWEQVFSHYLNLRLSSLVIDYALWLLDKGQAVDIDSDSLRLFTTACNLPHASSIEYLSTAIELAIVDIEAKVNGRVSELATLPGSILGTPLRYLFQALGGLGVDFARPFAFCIDEYENLSPEQQKLLNTLVKQVGGGPFTFKIGVRNKVAIERETLVHQQPLQDPADFITVDIVDHLKETSFDDFAREVIDQRLSSESIDRLELEQLLPALSQDEEATLLGAESIREQILASMEDEGDSLAREASFVKAASPAEAALLSRWASSHGEQVAETIRFAMDHPKQWKNRLNNYGYASLFTIRERSVGDRKYYAGWRTFWQLSDGNIRYLLRLVQEALRRHIEEDHELTQAVSAVNQTRAAKRVGEVTVRDLQGWSKRGAELTRLTVGLGGVFGSLARSSALATPEVVQFRVRYVGSSVASTEVDALLAEAVGQGVLVDFVANKEAADRGAPPEVDFQLHPVLAPTFSYSHRSKRRMTIQADDLMALSKRDTATAAFRRILGAHGEDDVVPPDQLDLFAELGS